MNTPSIAANIKTIEDLACYWFCTHGITHKAASSLKRDHGILRNYILPVFGKKEIKALKSRDVMEWFSRLQQYSRLSKKTCNDILGLFKKICNDGVTWEFLDKNPCTAVKKVKVQEKEMSFWDKNEIQEYLGFWLNRDFQPRVFWPVLLGLYTGMRRGEIVGLKWDCIDFNTGFITVKRSYCRVSKKIKEETKSKQIRRIPISKILAHHLRKLQTITLKSGFVAPFFSSDLYQKEFQRTAKTALVTKIRFHDLRHSFASNFLAAGGNIYDLQKILGHSTVQVTEKYTHLAPAQLVGKTEILEY